MKLEANMALGSATNVSIITIYSERMHPRSPSFRHNLACHGTVIETDVGTGMTTSNQIDVHGARLG